MKPETDFPLEFSAASESNGRYVICANASRQEQLISIVGSITAQLNLVHGVLQATDIGTFVLDMEERVVIWNQWMAEHSWHETRDALGKTFLELFPDMEDGKVHDAIRRTLRFDSQVSAFPTEEPAPFPLFSTRGDRALGFRMRQAVKVRPITTARQLRHCLVQITGEHTHSGR